MSGGSDSVALTVLLLDLAETLDCAVVSLAHLNHRLRPTADRDEQFCRDLAARLGLSIAVDAVDVQAYATAERLSLEEAARRARYTFLHTTARDCGADRIAVGHTRDDQAETFLMKLIRGAGLTGLGGIYPRRGILVRPLLDSSRAELRAHLVDRGQSWVEDESNEWVGNPRNRIRHRVLPELDLAYSGAARSIARAAAASREDGEWLDDLARNRYADLARVTEEGIELDAKTLQAEPAPVRRRVLRHGLHSAAGTREIGMEHVEMALDVLEGGCGAAEVPGCRVELRRGKLVLVSNGSPSPAPP